MSRQNFWPFCGTTVCKKNVAKVVMVSSPMQPQMLNLCNPIWCKEIEWFNHPLQPPFVTIFIQILWHLKDLFHLLLWHLFFNFHEGSLPGSLAKNWKKSTIIVRCYVTKTRNLNNGGWVLSKDLLSWSGYWKQWQRISTDYKHVHPLVCVVLFLKTRNSTPH